MTSKKYRISHVGMLLSFSLKREAYRKKNSQVYSEKKTGLAKKARRLSLRRRNCKKTNFLKIEDYGLKKIFTRNAKLTPNCFETIIKTRMCAHDDVCIEFKQLKMKLETTLSNRHI